MWADQLLSIFCMIVYFTFERLIVFEPNCGLYTAVIRYIRSEFKFPVKIEKAFSQILANLTNSNSF